MKNKMIIKSLINAVIIMAGFSLLGKAETIYIDQYYHGIKKGTMDQPFNSWKDLKWKEGNTYLFKCGNVFDVDYKLRPEANNITLGSYGFGDRPHFRSSVPNGEKVLDLAKYKNMVVKDLEIESTNNATTCLSYMACAGGAVINCKIHGAEWGIRNLASTGPFKILNCEIYMIGDDGCFIMNLDTIELAGSHIHDINQKYFINPSEMFSGGDCFQMLNVKYFYIHDNIIDHGITGNKFCIIAACLDTMAPGHGLIERNHLIRKGGILIYLGRVENIVMRYNRFENGDIALYNHSSNPQLYYNEFINITGNCFMLGAAAGSVTKIFNNTFYNINTLSNSYKDKVELQNNIFSKCYGTLYVQGTNPKTDYNCYNEINNYGSFNIGQHSIKADPLFNDVSKLDFKLKNGSPCIRTGIILLNNCVDKDGNSVPVDTAPDIGAHESYQ